MPKPERKLWFFCMLRENAGAESLLRKKCYYYRMQNKLKSGRYRHYKGNEYEVIGVAHHSETLEPLVVYKALYDSDEFGKNAMWVRPLALFTETITVDGKEVPRFEYIK